MDIIKSIVVALTSPLTLALLFLTIGWILAFTRARKTSRFFRFSAFIWLALCSQTFFADLMLYPLEHTFRTSGQNISIDKNSHGDVEQNSASPDYIHVLACYYNTSGNMTEVSRWSECSLQRNIEAYRLYTASAGKAKIIVTGGNFLREKEVEYAHKAVDFFVSLGVPQEDLIALPNGKNSYEEVKAVIGFYQQGDVWVVSSATHLTRLSILYEPLGENIWYQPVDFHSNGNLTPSVTLPSLSALTSCQHAFYEYFALAKLYLIPQ